MPPPPIPNFPSVNTPVYLLSVCFFILYFFFYFFFNPLIYALYNLCARVCVRRTAHPVCPATAHPQPVYCRCNVRVIILLFYVRAHVRSARCPGVVFVVCNCIGGDVARTPQTAGPQSFQEFNTLPCPAVD